ncbi:MAG: transcription elongation factor GreA [Myxococcota bacterium]|jgi:transcription elongation factor GreA
MEKFLITKEGHKKLQDEIYHLKNVARPNIIVAVAIAREHGDLKENAEYHSSREKQSMIEANIVNFEDKLARSQIVDNSTHSGDVVRFGATVKLENGDNGKEVIYTIVSEYEADIDAGLISNTSPVANALMGKKVGDELEIRTPGGVVDYEVLEIEYK